MHGTYYIKVMRQMGAPKLVISALHHGELFVPD